MSDQTPADESQADDAANDQSQADTAQTISLDDARKLRSEASSLRKRLREAESKVQAAEDDKKPELERLLAERDRFKSEHDRLLTELQSERAERLVTTAASKANALRPDAIFRLVREGLEFEDGKPTNVEDAIAAAKADYPELFRLVSGSGDGGKGGDVGSDPNAAINAAIRRAAGHASA
jgi:hypothetical protein